jgi:hypothetical protein
MNTTKPNQQRRLSLAALGSALLARHGWLSAKAEVSVFDFMQQEQIADVRAGTALIDVSEACEAATLAMFQSGGGTLHFPAGVYLLASTSKDKHSHYSYIVPRDNVSFVGAGMDVTVFRVQAGENARHGGTNGPNVIATKQPHPLRGCRFAGFTVDWNGANNLLGPEDTPRNNAAILSVNGGIDILCEDIKTIANPGNQCIFFPASAELGQRNITVRNCEAHDCGSGLQGNFNKDHSSFYCNGTHIRYENLRGYAERPVRGALFELHGSDSEAKNCHSNYYDQGFWIASNYQSIEGIVVKNCTHRNVVLAFSISAQAYSVDNVEIAHVDFYQRTGLIRPVFFINGNTIDRCSSLNIHHCKFIGGNYKSSRLMQHYKIMNLRFDSNVASGFGAYGINSAGVDLGDGSAAHLLSVTNNTFTDVAHPIYFSHPKLKIKQVVISGNTFNTSVAEEKTVITINASQAKGIIEKNMYGASHGKRPAMVNKSITVK